MKAGACGFLNADWGDNGHIQPLSSSLLGVAVGADVGWNVAADVQEARVVSVLARHVLRERRGCSVARSMYQLGRTYLHVSDNARCVGARTRCGLGCGGCVIGCVCSCWEGRQMHDVAAQRAWDSFVRVSVLLTCACLVCVHVCCMSGTNALAT